MKRSRSLRLSAMAIAPVALTACQPQMVDPPPQIARFDYPSLQSCFDADDIADGDCRSVRVTGRRGIDWALHGDRRQCHDR